MLAAAADDSIPGTGQVTIYNGSDSLGVGTLNGSGQATITADTSELHVGSVNLRVAYSGDDSFAPVSVTLPLTVDPAASSSDSSEVSDTSGEVGDVSDTTSTSAVTLASTGFATGPWLAGGALLLVTGSSILFGSRRRSRHNH